MDTADLTPIQRAVYAAVRRILDGKAGIHPRLAHMDEVEREMRDQTLNALRDLYRMDILSANLDVNKRPMFDIKNPIQS